MTSNLTQHARRRRRQFSLSRDVEHVVKVVRRVARKARAKDGVISTDNVRHAVETGPLHLLPAFADRTYQSSLYGKAMKEAARRGYIRLAGWTRTKRIGKRGGGAVRLWRAA